MEAENSYVKEEHNKAKKGHTTEQDILDDEIVEEITS